MLGGSCSPCCGECRPIVYSWGINTTYQLGNCTISGTVVSPPESVDQLDWSKLSGGEYAGAGIENNNLWTWGGLTWADIGWGNVGDTFAPRWIPRQVPGSWVSVALGNSVMLAIDTLGNLYSCGTASGDNTGQLGLSGITHPSVVYTLTQVGSDSGWTQCHASSNGACGVLNGSIYYWGFSNTNENYPTAYTTPRRLTSFTQQVTKVQDSGQYRMALTAGGDLYAWWFWDSSPDPVLIDSGVSDFSLADYVRLTYNYPGTFVFDPIGAVYLKTDGTLCQTPVYRMQGDTSSQPILFSGEWSAVAASGFAMAVKSDGYLFTWGNDGTSALGNGPGSATVNTPTQIGTRTWTPVIACGSGAAYAKAIQ